MLRKKKLIFQINVYGLKSKFYFPVPSKEVDELFYYVDEIPGDERGME